MENKINNCPKKEECFSVFKIGSISGLRCFLPPENFYCFTSKQQAVELKLKKMLWGHTK
jgi:hypothetical protein